MLGTLTASTTKPAAEVAGISETEIAGDGLELMLGISEAA